MSEKKQHSVKVPRLFKTAASILKKVKEGGNLKTLVYSQRFCNIKALYALVVESLRHGKQLDQLIAKSRILVKEAKLDPWLARILITELLWGVKKLPGNSKPVETVLSYKKRFLDVLQSQLIEEPRNNQEVLIPRYVRVNTIRISVESALKFFCDEGWQKIEKKFKNYDKFLKRVTRLSEQEFMQDFHMEDVLVFPPKTEFYKHPLYENGSILLQDKVSCLAARLLDPEPGSTVLDMCAAPGMKATYLAALMDNRGKVFAVEHDHTRYLVLCDMVELAGATCVQPVLDDSLNTDSQCYDDACYVLVDPTCSGSGIVDRKVLDPDDKPDKTRLFKLGGFQTRLLQKALREYPRVRRVVYSTCSLNAEENELVVDRALKAVYPTFQLSKNAIPPGWKNRGSTHYEWGKHCLYARPKDDFTNGFFIAVFERCDDSSAVVDTSKKNVSIEKKKRKLNCSKITNKNISNDTELPLESGNWKHIETESSLGVNLDQKQDVANKKTEIIDDKKRNHSASSSGNKFSKETDDSVVTCKIKQFVDSSVTSCGRSADKFKENVKLEKCIPKTESVNESTDILSNVKLKAEKVNDSADIPSIISESCVDTKQLPKDFGNQLTGNIKTISKKKRTSFIVNETCKKLEDNMEASYCSKEDDNFGQVAGKKKKPKERAHDKSISLCQKSLVQETEAIDLYHLIPKKKKRKKNH